MTGPSVSLSNVGLKYADNIILQNISAEFENAKCHVIMGP
ncbi:metal ABC transporter ATP-binding protein, partial [Vibrio parahaemolyticus]|nr:metal ABC transporter ATP-binding protein [Vibrio parahaemolyticus]MDF4961915.1 metal ABC transporter ATP-binding protein [Vibrio parahaemolyticus]